MRLNSYVSLFSRKRSKRKNKDFVLENCRELELKNFCREQKSTTILKIKLLRHARREFFFVPNRNIFSVLSITQAKQIINLLLLNNFFSDIVPTSSRGKESDELSYTIWSLVMVRDQLPAQVVGFPMAACKPEGIPSGEMARKMECVLLTFDETFWQTCSLDVRSAEVRSEERERVFVWSCVPWCAELRR